MNSVHLIGRLTRDIDVKTSQSGMSFGSFNLAVNRQFKKEGEERQADFINCKVFGKTAEFMAKYFSKGSQVAVDGRIQTGSYDKDGTKVYTTDVIVTGVHFCGKAEGGGSAEANFFPVELKDDELPF